MAYYLDLFSPETFEAFLKSDRTISGFRQRHRGMASRVKPGDVLVCYLTGVSRWCGLLQVIRGPFEDATPRFTERDDPFVVRFVVTPQVLLEPQNAIPIKDDLVWRALTFTRALPKTSHVWTGKLRSSLNVLDEADGKLLESCIRQQASTLKAYPLSEMDAKRLRPHRVRTLKGTAVVTVPDEETTTPSDASPKLERESIRMQAQLASIGAKMGFRVWLPAADRERVLKDWTPKEGELLDKLPLNYEEATLSTIERIDVLWLRKRSIARAFEVEHTTAIYSGLLRMADLLALQPDLKIAIHIVAPAARRDKVLEEISRPAFTYLDRGPLAECCTYLSYESVREIADEKNLEHLSDSVLDKYAEGSD